MLLVYVAEKKVNEDEALYYIRVYDKNLKKLGEKSIQASKHYGASFITKNVDLWNVGNFNGEVVPINIIGMTTKGMIDTGLGNIKYSLYKSFLYNLKTNTFIESKDYTADLKSFKRIEEHKKEDEIYR